MRYKAPKAVGGRIVVTYGGVRRATETRYTVGAEDVRDLITEGPCNILLWGDSISSYGALPRLPMAMAMEWPVPNGWSGWFIPANMSASGTLVNYANSQGEAYSWPFCGFSYNTLLGIAGFTVTAYDNSNNYATTNVVGNVPSPLPKPCKVISKSGTAWNFPVFTAFYMGPQGICQSGKCWASGDWITGKASNALRVGFCHIANSATVTASMRVNTQEGFGNASGAAAGNVMNTITPTAPATPAAEIVWASLAASSVNTPFGTVENEPGRTQNPVYQQYEGVGSTVPGTIMNATYLAAAGNSDWTGCLAVRTTYDANSTPTGTNIVPYGVIIEDTTNTTGMYVDNISMSGDKITAYENQTVQQMANVLNLNTARPINLVIMHIGENETTAEWNGGSINAAQIKADLLARIQRVYDGWDLAGLPRGLILLSSPWETVGGTKSGSAWYTTLANIMRDIARSDSRVKFVDTRQMFADRFSAEEMYHASRNVHMNILADATHPSVRGVREWGRMLWRAIMGSINE